jgi:hypothetical protein
MKRGRSTGNPTKAEAAWIDAIKRAGCICCEAEGFPHEDGGSVVEAHHLLSGGIRRGHIYTVGLCAWHHRGRLIVEGWSHADHREWLGPSLAEGSVPFHAHFGDDDRLQQKQRDLLELRKAA